MIKFVPYVGNLLSSGILAYNVLIDSAIKDVIQEIIDSGELDSMAESFSSYNSSTDLETRAIANIDSIAIENEILEVPRFRC